MYRLVYVNRVVNHVGRAEESQTSLGYFTFTVVDGSFINQLLQVVKQRKDHVPIQVGRNGCGQVPFLNTVRCDCVWRCHASSL
jgi:hypothetical protein